MPGAGLGSIGHVIEKMIIAEDRAVAGRERKERVFPAGAGPQARCRPKKAGATTSEKQIPSDWIGIWRSAALGMTEKNGSEDPPLQKQELFVEQARLGSGGGGSGGFSARDAYDS